MEEEEGREKRGLREKTCQVTLRRGSGNLSCCISKWMIMTPQGGGEKGRFDEINRSDVVDVFACVRSPTQPKVDAHACRGLVLHASSDACMRVRLSEIKQRVRSYYIRLKCIHNMKLTSMRLCVNVSCVHR